MVDAALRAMARNHRILALVLIHLVVLNVLDLLFTFRALALGAIEVNPLMALLFELAPTLAAVLKVKVAVVVVVGMWLLRRYRRTLQIATLATAWYATLFGYHLFLVVRYG